MLGMTTLSLTGQRPTVIYDGTYHYKTPQQSSAMDALLGFRPPPTPYNHFHIYGGDNHDQYLGCLTCSPYEATSIWNEYGSYGSGYSDQSIWNNYGEYGNSYSDLSPWNSYGSTPPVVVDKNGTFYGYLTVNSYYPQRATGGVTQYLYLYWDQIRKDVDGWYEKIFR